MVILMLDLIDARIKFQPIIKTINLIIQLLAQPFIISFSIGNVLGFIGSVNPVGILGSLIALGVYVIFNLSYAQQIVKLINSNVSVKVLGATRIYALLES